MSRQELRAPLDPPATTSTDRIPQLSRTHQSMSNRPDAYRDDGLYEQMPAGGPEARRRPYGSASIAPLSTSSPLHQSPGSQHFDQRMAITSILSGSTDSQIETRAMAASRRLHELPPLQMPIERLSTPSRRSIGEIPSPFLGVYTWGQGTSPTGRLGHEASPRMVRQVPVTQQSLSTIYHEQSSASTDVTPQSQTPAWDSRRIRRISRSSSTRGVDHQPTPLHPLHPLAPRPGASASEVPHLTASSSAASQLPPLSYEIRIRQQPTAARACGYGERDRRVIDPPPILDLRITDPNTNSTASDPSALLAIHCTLLNAAGTADETNMPEPSSASEPQSSRRLIGTLVASPYDAKDEHNTPGSFFVFPDLSCRTPGEFRLRFKLLRIDPLALVPGTMHGSVATVVSDVFTVFTAKHFPGMSPSSGLLRALRAQGLNVGIRRGVETSKRRGRRKRESSSRGSSGTRDADQEQARRHEHRPLAPSESPMARTPSSARRTGKRPKLEIAEEPE